MRQPNLPSAVYHCIRHSLRDYMLFHSEYQIFTEQKKNRVAVSVHGQRQKETSPQDFTESFQCRSSHKRRVNWAKGCIDIREIHSVQTRTQK